MTTYDYLIIGGGQVADDASRGIRELDDDGMIGILSADVDGPYTRPALSKKLWTDPEFDVDQVPLNTAQDTGAELRLRTLVTAIDRDRKEVELEGGERVGYGKLLLATGSTPRPLDGPESDRLIFFRSFADYRRLRELATDGSRIVVVGGGYIGAELAAGLVQNRVRTQLVFPDEVLGGSLFPAEIAARYQALFSDSGVELLPGRRAQEVRNDPNGALTVVLDDGTELAADAVVVGLGAAPVLGLAERAGLEVGQGVVVDQHLATSDPAIWAAGDIAEYPDAILGRTRIEHVDSAREMGTVVGRSMAGSSDPYTYTPYFYSVVFEVGWEAVGTLDSQLETLQVDLGEGRAVVYYLDEGGRPAGVLLWQVDEARDAARQVLADAPTDPAELRERIR